MRPIMPSNSSMLVCRAVMSAAYGWVLVVALLALVGCRPGGESSGVSPSAEEPHVLRIAAASDLKFALDEVIQAYQKDHAAVRIEATYGSSGNLYAQLTNRAPFDLFLSADIGYPRKLIDAGLADPASEFLYGIGQIVVWSAKDSKLAVDQRGIESLKDPAVRRIAIANPAHAPYGRAAEAALKSLGAYEAVQDRLVLGDNIAQTAQFVESGAADVGIIALALALAPPMRDKGRYWLVPVDSYPRLEQGGVIMSDTRERKETEGFRAYLIDRPGREIMAGYGFALPEE